MLKSKYKYNFHNEDLHIHFLDAASKKDGPSAGLAIAVSLCSIKENIKIPSNYAFKNKLFGIIDYTSAIVNFFKWQYFKNWWTQRKVSCCI